MLEQLNSESVELTVPHLLLIRKYMLRISYPRTSEQSVLNEGFKNYILSLHTDVLKV
jgi:hypothetical protein